MKLLIITNLFPNSLELGRGIFNNQQFAELAKLCDLRVIAPIPWYRNEAIPHEESMCGIKTYHYRYFTTPKIGRSLYAFFFYLSLLPKIRKLYKEFKFDAILATWAYPDAVGSYFCAKVLKKRFFVKVHGSDINFHAKYAFRRAQIAYVLTRSDKVIAVSNELKEKLVGIGVPANKIEVVPNGVNTELFKPLDQADCRKKNNLPHDKKIVLYVGNFAQVKGVGTLISAFAKVVQSKKDVLLVLVGDGPLENAIREEVKHFKIEKHIVFVGRRPHGEIGYYMNACDLLCLPSFSEGCPNVVLENMACGRPVVASNVGGLADIVCSNDLGLLIIPGDSNVLAKALIESLEKKWDYCAMRKMSLGYSWADSAARLKTELDRAS